MNGNDNSFSPALFRKDVVAALYPGKNPSFALDGARQFFS